MPSQNEELGSQPIPQADAFGDLVEFYHFRPKQIEFLKEFQKDCDLERAGKAVGYSKSTLQKFLDPHTELGQAMLREIRAIQEDWMKAIKLNAQKSAVKHLELMEKFENDYDQADLKSPVKGMLAGTLAKMSDASLKATGQFNREGTSSGVRVEINIDLTSNQEKPIDITGEAKIVE